MCESPGGIGWSQPGQRYGFRPAAPGTVRTSHSPSAATSVRDQPTGETPRGTLGEPERGAERRPERARAGRRRGTSPVSREVPRLA